MSFPLRLGANDVEGSPDDLEPCCGWVDLASRRARRFPVSSAFDLSGSGEGAGGRSSTSRRYPASLARARPKLARPLPVQASLQRVGGAQRTTGNISCLPAEEWDSNPRTGRPANGVQDPGVPSPLGRPCPLTSVPVSVDERAAPRTNRLDSENVPFGREWARVQWVTRLPGAWRSSTPKAKTRTLSGKGASCHSRVLATIPTEARRSARLTLLTRGRCRTNLSGSSAAARLPF